MVIILMGVMGSGKTTIGIRLAAALGCPFHDSDDHHSDESKQKMTSGEPLTDKDRKPWLENLAALIGKWNRQSPVSVLACSALKREYRDLLSSGNEVRWVYLKGPVDLVKARLAQRRGHFADPRLLESQYAILEEPRDAIVVDIGEGPDQMVEKILATLKRV